MNQSTVALVVLAFVMTVPLFFIFIFIFFFFGSVGLTVTIWLTENTCYTIEISLETNKATGNA